MSDTLIDKPTIINWALSDLGSFSTFSTEDDSDLADQIEKTWQRCVDHCFGLHDWTFARRTYKLNRHAAQPDNGWQYGFDLPGGMIGDPLKMLERAGQSPQPLRHYDIEGRAVYANVPQCWARVRQLVRPDKWDPAFRAAFTVALAGYLAVPVTHNSDERDARMVQAFGTPSKEGTGGMFGRLIAQNRAAAPVGQPLLNDDPLTAARDSFGGMPWHGRY